MAEHYKSRIGAEHEHGAMGEIKYAKRPKNDREAAGDQGEQAAQRDAIEGLRQELGNVGMDRAYHHPDRPAGVIDEPTRDGPASHRGRPLHHARADR